MYVCKCVVLHKNSPDVQTSPDFIQIHIKAKGNIGNSHLLIVCCDK